MEDAELSVRIAQALAQAWLFHQSPSFADYAKQTFGCDSLQLVKCDGIYIGEAEGGDATAGSIGGLIKHWWFIDDQGLTPVVSAKLPRFRDAPGNLRSQFYLTPVIKFLRQEGIVAIGEAFGPDMHCRKVGEIVVINDSVTIHGLRVIWSNSTI